MSVVELLVNVMGPVILIVGFGWFAGTRMSFDVATLSRLSFWVIGPVFVLDVFADAELDRSIVVRLSLAGVLSMAVGGALAYLAGRRMGIGNTRTKGVVMTSAYGNVGNAGLAISAFAFGESAIPTAAVLMIVINCVGILLGVALATAQTSGLGAALRRAFTAPMTIAAAVAVAMNLAGWTFPTALERSISIVGAALIPIMLISLGLQLAGDVRPTLDADFSVVAVAKLLVVPLVAAGIGLAFGLEGDVLGVLVIQSSMPPAVFTAVVALEFDLQPARVTQIVLGTTLLSLLTIPVALVAVT